MNPLIAPPHLFHAGSSFTSAHPVHLKESPAAFVFLLQNMLSLTDATFRAHFSPISD